MATVPKDLTQDELKRVLAAIDSPRDKALFGLIYHYGLRVSEALMLTVDDVHFTNHRIAIRRWSAEILFIASCRRLFFEPVLMM